MQNERHSQGFAPIAIIGVGAMFARSNNAAQFWFNITSNKDLITDVPADHWLIEDYYDPDPKAPDKTYCKRGSFLDHIDFDPMEFGIPPKILEATDSTQLLSLVVAKQVLNDLNQQDKLDLGRTGVILGITSAQELVQSATGRLQRPLWVNAMRKAGLPEDEVQKICDDISNSYVPWQENTFPGLLGNVIAGRIANRFNFSGTNCVVDAACASSLAALNLAISELQLGRTDTVIAGGADTLNDIFMYTCFSKTPALSMTGDCRPFSDAADGTILGEGLGLFLLKRLSDAERDGDDIYAVIRGVGTSSDGRGKSIYAPDSKGQSLAIKRAYEQAGFSPETVEMVEAHGTGTKAGDAAELKGLCLAFNSKTNKQYCALGSVKSQIGHTKAAAGAASLFKAVMALRHKTLPGTIKVDKPSSAFDVKNSAFYINTSTRPWVRGQSHPRRVGVSSFGFGGSNYHVVLEEYRGVNQHHRLRQFDSELVVFAAKDLASLKQNIQAALDEIQPKQDTQTYLRYFAYKTQQAFQTDGSYRLAIVAVNDQALKSKCAQAIAKLTDDVATHWSLPSGIYFGSEARAGKVAFLFPGQGSQYINMGADLAMQFDSTMQAWDKVASTELNAEQSLQAVVFPRPVFDPNEREQQITRLTQTEWAQPAIAATSLSQLALLRALDVKADCVAGHSFGEITALHAADAMDVKTLLHIARKRGELMAACENTGAMLAVKGDAVEIESLLKAWKLKVVAANYNSPQQIVLSGSVEAIEEVSARLQVAGMQCTRLAVATAFHSEFVARAREPFMQYLQTQSINKLNLPVYANKTAKPYAARAGQVAKMLADQLISPVRFQEQITNMYADGVRTFIEVGPHSVLTNLVSRCLEGQGHVAIALDRKGKDGMSTLWKALAQMVCVGINPDFSALWDEYDAVAQPPASNKKHTFKINGTNYGKPYPPPGGAKDLAKPNLTKKPMQHKKETSMSNNNNTNNPHLIAMYQAMQQQLVYAHNTYQKAMADSHMAFLNAMGQMVNPNMANTAVNIPAMSAPMPQAMPTAAAPMPVAPMAAPAPMPQAPVMAAAPAPMPQAPMMAAPAPMPQAPMMASAPAPIAQQAAPVAQAAAVTVATAGNMQALLLDVVADKTGYPVEMLDMNMDMEADLSIDSIKRVEILAAVQEKVTNLPEVDPNEMASMRTLGEILAYMKGSESAPAAANTNNLAASKKKTTSSATS